MRALIIPACLWLWSPQFPTNPACVFLSHNAYAPQTHQIKYETVTRGREGARYSELTKERSDTGLSETSITSNQQICVFWVIACCAAVRLQKLWLHQEISGCVPAVRPAAPQDDVQTLMLVGHQLWWNNFTFHEITHSGLWANLQWSWI